mmetsp:Transcript_5868/g.17965  ORF Transcript_5868/g.17965 Transcript_5868/m.17965 type:complete len:214 (+) Transcript_5868:779-1420(+)
MQLGNALSRLLPPSSRTPQAGRHAHRVGANVYVQAMLASHCLQRMSNGGLVGYGQSKRLVAKRPHRHVAGEAALDGIPLLLQEVRHPRQHVDVSAANHRPLAELATRQAVVQQLRLALREVSHLEVGGANVVAEKRADPRLQVSMADQLLVERPRHTSHGHVVECGAHTSRRDDELAGLAHEPHLVRDGVHIVWHHCDALDRPANGVQLGTQE